MGTIKEIRDSLQQIDNPTVKPCAAADIVNQVGGTCYYFAVLISIVGSSMGRVWLKDVTKAIQMIRPTDNMFSFPEINGKQFFCYSAKSMTHASSTIMFVKLAINYCQQAASQHKSLFFGPSPVLNHAPTNQGMLTRSIQQHTKSKPHPGGYVFAGSPNGYKYALNAGGYSDNVVDSINSGLMEMKTTHLYDLQLVDLYHYLTGSGAQLILLSIILQGKNPQGDGHAFVAIRCNLEKDAGQEDGWRLFAFGYEDEGKAYQLHKKQMMSASIMPTQIPVSHEKAYKYVDTLSAFIDRAGFTTNHQIKALCMIPSHYALNKAAREKKEREAASRHSSYP
jgi:hypothetical protein